jgi:hypothetical protein
MGNSSQTSSPSTKAGNLRERRLYSISRPDSNLCSGQQKSNPVYQQSVPSMNDNSIKTRGNMRVKSITTSDENGELRTTYYTKSGKRKTNQDFVINRLKKLYG